MRLSAEMGPRVARAPHCLCRNDFLPLWPRVVDRYHDSFRWLADDHVPAIMGDVGLSLKARTFEGAHDPPVKHGIRRQRRLGRRVRGPRSAAVKNRRFHQSSKNWLLCWDRFPPILSPLLTDRSSSIYIMHRVYLCFKYHHTLPCG